MMTTAIKTTHGEHTDIDTRAKLNRSQQLYVCQLIAEGKSTYDIIEDVQSVFGITLSENTIRHTYRCGRKWRPIWRWLRKRMEYSFSEIAIANKAIRLRRHEMIYQIAMKGVVVDVDGTLMVKRDYYLAINVLREARNELKAIETGVVLADNSTHITNIDNRKYEGVNVDEMESNDLVKLFRDRASAMFADRG